MSARVGSAARVMVSLLAIAVVAACGGGAQPDQQRSGSGGGFPVSVTGKFGTTTVPEKPVRVVAMSWTDADFALALGVTPVGIAKAPDSPNGLEPWTAAALGDAKPTQFSTVGSDPIEQVAGLAPDLILATKDYNLGQSYQQLSQIAPVVTYAGAPNTDSWQQALGNVAAALGLAEQGRKLTTDTEAQIAAQKVTHPELTGKTFSYVVAPTAAGVYTVNSDQDVSAQLLAGLGMRLSPKVLTLPTSGLPGRAQLSLENLSVLDADIILVAAASQQDLDAFAKNPVAESLGAVRRGAYVPFNYTTAVSIAFPSTLSLRWAMTQVVPKLSAAAKA
jgi:iron complex transport system substrate-binding protein